MKRLEKTAIIISLVESLKTEGSWCGETHIQKATYFLQELLGVPLEYNFILYKHGPYSFDLTDELTAMRADGLLTLVPQYPYGPSILPGDQSEQVKRQYKQTIEKYRFRIQFVANKLGNHGVASLERLATALFVTIEEKNNDIDIRAQKIHKFKPHISIDEAREAVVAVDNITFEAKMI